MLNNAKLPSPSPTPPPASTERVSVKNPCGELEAILLRLAAQIDSEREAQGLSVAELARQARLGRRTLTYGRKVQSGAEALDAARPGEGAEPAAGSSVRASR